MQTRASGLIIALRGEDVVAATTTVPGGMVVAPSLVSAGSAQTSSVIRSLEPDKPIERELAGGQTHKYQIELLAGQHLHVAVDQRGIDLAALRLMSLHGAF